MSGAPPPPENENYILFVSGQCPDCREFMAILQENQDKLKLSIQMVNVDTQQYPPQVQMVPAIVIQVNHATTSFLQGAQAFQWLKGKVMSANISGISPDQHNFSFLEQQQNHNVLDSKRTSMFNDAAVNPTSPLPNNSQTQGSSPPQQLPPQLQPQVIKKADENFANQAAMSNLANIEARRQAELQ